MKEANLQRHCLAYCREIGALAVKVDSTSSRGWPDITVVLPNGVVLFVELKTSAGRVSKLQERMIGKLKENNANAYIIRSAEQFRTLIKSYFIN